ncbi:MAG: hypothetical protein PVF17_00575 [Ignavibacteria bacterium]|jgi:hypothetical protein
MSNQESLLDYNGNVEFASSEPRHYDRVPSILDHLTYIAEEIDTTTGERRYYRRRLTPTEKEVYRVLRYRAGSSKCFRSTEDLASHVGCGKNTITESKRILQMPFEQLEGSPLIHVEEKYTRTMDGDKCINKKPVHMITVLNIWAYNNAFMDRVDHKNLDFPERKQEIPKEEAEWIIERLAQPGPVKIVHNSGGHPEKETSFEANTEKGKCSLGGSSRKRDVNKEHINKDHCLITDPPSADGRNCLFKEISVSDCFDNPQKALETLEFIGIPIKIARKFLKTYPLSALRETAYYVQGMMKKKPVKSIPGYYRMALEKNWYLTV